MFKRGKIRVAAVVGDQERIMLLIVVCIGRLKKRQKNTWQIKERVTNWRKNKGENPLISTRRSERIKKALTQIPIRGFGGIMGINFGNKLGTVKHNIWNVFTC